MCVESVVETGILLVQLADEAAVVSVESVTGVATSVRRRVLSRITARERTTREELAAALADDDEVPLDDSERLAVTLHHDHLPRLDDEGYLEYDPRTGDVVRWKDPRTIEAALESDAVR